MTIEYGIPGPPTVAKHDYIYTTLLGVLGFFLLIRIAMMYLVGRMPGQAAEVKFAVMAACAMYGLLSLAIAVVILVRLRYPLSRRWLTFGMNIILLLVFPFGTALAIYGFWKVDKKLPPPVVSQ